MIIDSEQELETLFNYISSATTTMVVPILTDVHYHPVKNKICCIYLYTDEVEAIIPIRHSEQICSLSSHVQRLLDMKNIFVHDKKVWLQIGGNKQVYDIKTLWWYTYGESYDMSYYINPSLQFYYRRHRAGDHINAIIPLMTHLRTCQHIRKYAWPMIKNVHLDESFLRFNSTYPDVFAEIEQAGLCIDFDEFHVKELIHDNFVYSQYNYHTMTGRPSNAFGGFNFAAMNKEDGTRDAFQSRFTNGKLIEFDFDAYHIRIIAKMIGYEFPDISVHEYLGKFYFSTNELTIEQYEQSKQITFRLLYGGIDHEFLKIPFFKKTNDLVYEIWNRWKHTKIIRTPILKRSINIPRNTQLRPYKLFNYLLQATETEISVEKIQLLQNSLRHCTSKIILYTYDSILIDVNSEEEDMVLGTAQEVLSKGGFYVKHRIGDIYSKMKK
jgi:hypothetical protein